MKYLLYLPFLLLMAVTYSRVAENFNSEQAVQSASRGPASVEVSVQPECLNTSEKFNPHFHTEDCL